MFNIREWIDRDDKTAERVPKLLPILIRQARMEMPITYGDAALELGIHHRAIHHIAGYIGYTLEAISRTPGWKRRAPPPLHSLVVNDITELPGRGINGFMSSEYKKAKSSNEQRAILKAIYSGLKDYAHWEEVCDLLDVPIDENNLTSSIEKARTAKGRGGEGPEHKALKEFVRTHPEILGLPSSSGHGMAEFRLASGDSVDIVFSRQNVCIAVEIKPEKAEEGDKIRGVFQCLKYKTVLEAESALSKKPFQVRTILVLGDTVPTEVIQVSNRLGIKVIGGISPC